VCTNLGTFSITVPPGSDAGTLIANGKHRIEIGHTNGTADRGFLMWANAAANCGTDASDTLRSHFGVPSSLPTATGGLGANAGYIMTVTTVGAFTVPAGGGTFTVFLNGVMQAGGGTNDFEGEDFVTLTFTPNSP